MRTTARSIAASEECTALMPTPPRPGSPKKLSSRMESAWRYHADGTISYRFAVPANTTATLLLPGEDAATLLPGTHELQRTAP